MKVAVVGAGAVGGLIAGRLAASAKPGEPPVGVFARGATLAALRERGIELQTPGGASPRHAVTASDDPAALGRQDLVIVAVKAPALEAVASAVQALCAEHTTVLVAMNGVPWWFFHGLGGPTAEMALETADPRGAIARAIPVSRVLGCVVHCSAQAPAPGTVLHVGGDSLIVGEPAGGTSERLRSVAARLRRAGFVVTESERIQRDIWYKLWGNMTMNPVSALTGATCDRILDDPLVRAFCSAVMVEARAIGAAIGLPIDQDPEARHAVTRKLGAFKTSMLQDIDNGRAIELDALVGTVREIGERLGLATPNIDALFGLARLMARGKGLYPGA
jgi:2-dehydropantoate 2-reductase